MRPPETLYLAGSTYVQYSNGRQDKNIKFEREPLCVKVFMICTRSFIIKVKVKRTLAEKDIVRTVLYVRS